MKHKEESYLPIISSKHAELLERLNDARSKAAGIRQAAIKEMEEIVRAAEMAADEAVEKEREADSAEVEEKCQEQLHEAEIEAKRLVKRAEKRSKEVSQLIFARLLLKERR